MALLEGDSSQLAARPQPQKAPEMFSLEGFFRNADVHHRNFEKCLPVCRKAAD